MVLTSDEIEQFITKNCRLIISVLLAGLALISMFAGGWDGFFKFSISLAGLVFAFFQWQINKQNTEVNVDRLRLDLFDKRIKVYDSFIDIISVIVQKDEIERKDIFEFNFKKIEADFLFDDDVSAYGEKIYKKTLEFKRVSQKLKSYSGDTTSKEYDDLGIQKDKIGLWFYEQYRPCKELFVKYIGFKVRADK